MRNANSCAQMDTGDVKWCGVHAKREVGGDGDEKNELIVALIQK